MRYKTLYKTLCLLLLPIALTTSLLSSNAVVLAANKKAPPLATTKQQEPTIERFDWQWCHEPWGPPEKICFCADTTAGTLRLQFNTANDGSDTGDWIVLNQLGVPDYRCEFDSDRPPTWGQMDYPDGDYLVRLLARGDGGWEAAAQQDLTITLPQNRRPNRPEELSPRSLEEIDGNTVLFRWRETLRTTTYLLTVATDSSFAQPVFEQEIPSGTTELSHTFKLAEETRLYWRVRSTGPFGTNEGDQRFVLIPSASGPEIALSQESLTINVAQGKTVNRSFEITNKGGEPLNISIGKRPPSVEAATQRRATNAVSIEQLDVARIDDELVQAMDATEESGQDQHDVMIYLREQADLSDLHHRDRASRGQHTYDQLRETAQRTQADLLAWLKEEEATGAVKAIQPHFIVNAIALTANRATIETLLHRAEVATIGLEKQFEIPQPSVSQPIHAARVPTASGVAWGVEQIEADRVWTDFDLTGQGIVVANIDTGVDHTHPALSAQYRGSQAAGTQTNRHDFNWFDPTRTETAEPHDANGHGTHVMGTTVGDDGSGNQIGVAPGARWIAAKGCDSQSCRESDLILAAEWMLAPCPIGIAPGSLTCDPAKRPHIINNSWGGGGGDTRYLAFVDAWRAAGILPIFSAGNAGHTGESSLSSPGDYGQSFAVGATGQDDFVALFSSRGPSRLTAEVKPNVTAPGKQIYSAALGGGYAFLSGTSMASPHVAGAAALLLQADPTLSVDQIEQLLMNSALDLGVTGPDMAYGNGRINVWQAMDDLNEPFPWLRVAPATASIAVGASNSVDITFGTTGLDVGSHDATLYIDSNDPENPLLVLPIQLSITELAISNSQIRASNLTDKSAVISWISNRPTTGRIRFGSSPDALVDVSYDVRGQTNKDDVHYVKLQQLAPDMVYYFQIESDSGGSGQSGSTANATTGHIDDNQGALYSFRTGKVLSLPRVDSIYGVVYKSDGTPAANVLIYLRILNDDGHGNVGQSSLLSVLSNNRGEWLEAGSGTVLNLARALNNELDDYFTYSRPDDQLLAEIHGGADCNAILQFDSGEQFSPAPDMTLSCLQTQKIHLSHGWNVVTLSSKPEANYDTTALFADAVAQGSTIDEIDRWHVTDGSWVPHTAQAPIGNFDINASTPYFVRTDGRRLLQLPMTPSIHVSQQITLTKGWNFVSLPLTAANLTADGACTQIQAQGGSAIQIAYWGADRWSIHRCGDSTLHNAFALAASQGYFVNSDVDSTWIPQASTTATHQALQHASVIAAPEEKSSLAQPTINNVQISNIGAKRFTISWQTDQSASGTVSFGTAPESLANRATSTLNRSQSSRIHAITVEHLHPETRYYFQLHSDATVDDNQGELYQVTTGPLLGIPTIEAVRGRVLKADGTPAAGALVTLAMEGVSALSTRANSSGAWLLNLGELRDETGMRYGVPSASAHIHIVSAGGVESTGIMELDLPRDEVHMMTLESIPDVAGRVLYLPIVQSP